jgi:hypothetical protein
MATTFEGAQIAGSSTHLHSNAHARAQGRLEA